MSNERDAAIEYSPDPKIYAEYDEAARKILDLKDEALWEVKGPTEIEFAYHCYLAGAASVQPQPSQCGNCGFEPYDPEIFDECGGVRLDLIKPKPPNAPTDATLLDQYRTALENFGVTFADNGLIRKIPRHSTEARYLNALTEILALKGRHAKDCHIIAREALKGVERG